MTSVPYPGAVPQEGGLAEELLQCDESQKLSSHNNDAHIGHQEANLLKVQYQPIMFAG